MQGIRQIKGKGRLALLFTLIAWLAIGCDSAQPPSLLHPSSSSLPGRYSYTPAPSRIDRKTIVFSDTQFPDSLNPLFASSTIDFEVEAALWARPVFYDEQFHVHPDQLTRVPLPQNGDVQDAGKTIIMHLRHDLHWSDGQPLLASDFRYWWQLDQDPDTGAITTSGYDQIASIDTPDNFTVLLHMKQPFGPYLFYLPFAAPQHAWKNLKPIDLQNISSVYQAPPVTDGPYMLANYHDGQSYTLVPNSHYISTTFHGPFASQLIYQAYSTISALSMAIQHQQTDVALGYTEEDSADISSSPHIHILRNPTTSYEHLDFNLAHPVLEDIHVRQAIQMAINKCEMVKEVEHLSDCSRVLSQVEPLPSLVYDAHIAPSLYDPTAAKKLLAQVGWFPNAAGMLTNSHGQPLSLRLVTTADNPVRATLAQYIAQSLKAIGIGVQVKMYPLNQFFALYTRGGILATGQYDISLFGYANRPEPDDEYTVFSSSQIPSANNPNGGNYGRIADPIIDQALTLGRTTVPFEKRIPYYHQFLERVANQVYLIPLFTDGNTLVVNDRIHNVIPNPNVSDTFWNIADWWTAF
ncbi:MAG: peptide ABC transporter substrate-binding protein [Chloroflexota bacterium]|nr:peptide ABC transporter substrate-binding protein [Chloroflexota bacterium]